MIFQGTKKNCSLYDDFPGDSPVTMLICRGTHFTHWHTSLTVMICQGTHFTHYDDLPGDTLHLLSWFARGHFRHYVDLPGDTLHSLCWFSRGHFSHYADLPGSTLHSICWFPGGHFNGYDDLPGDSLLSFCWFARGHTSVTTMLCHRTFQTLWWFAGGHLQKCCHSGDFCLEVFFYTCFRASFLTLVLRSTTAHHFPSEFHNTVTPVSCFGWSTAACSSCHRFWPTGASATQVSLLRPLHPLRVTQSETWHKGTGWRRRPDETVTKLGVGGFLPAGPVHQKYHDRRRSRVACKELYMAVNRRENYARLKRILHALVVKVMQSKLLPSVIVASDGCGSTCTQWTPPT